ncbi:MAG: hypothetical protein QME66_11495 [Candidatus Eisenbacteria bacterium]|nr:hypothetical protein [Candidatus Eisenbacteria bacterium]
MKKLAMLLAIAAIAAYATGAFAFLNEDGKIVVSLRGIDAKGRCEWPTQPTPTNCSQLVLQGAINTPYHCQILVADFNNLTAEEFGLSYPPHIFVGTDKLDCTPNAFVLKSPSPPFPASGSGVVIAHSCVNYTGTLLNLGFIYVFAYAPGTLCIAGSCRANTAELTDCQGKTDVIWPIPGMPSHLGCVGFGEIAGYDGSCGVSTPVTPSTWGNIKALYK